MRSFFSCLFKENIFDFVNLGCVLIMGIIGLCRGFGRFNYFNSLISCLIENNELSVKWSFL